MIKNGNEIMMEGRTEEWNDGQNDGQPISNIANFFKVGYRKGGYKKSHLVWICTVYLLNLLFCLLFYRICLTLLFTRMDSPKILSWIVYIGVKGFTLIVY